MCTRADPILRNISGRIPQLKIEQKPLDTCEIELTVEVDAERLDKAKRAAARRLAQKLSIPGFRKGKAPYEIVLRTLGEGGVDFPALKAHLDTIGWQGWLTVELDSSPFRPPKESARISKEYIEKTLRLRL